MKSCDSNKPIKAAWDDSGTIREWNIPSAFSVAHGLVRTPTGPLRHKIWVVKLPVLVGVSFLVGEDGA